MLNKLCLQQNMWTLLLHSYRGRYGIVQKCISKKTQEAVAAKYLRLRSKKRLEIRREAELHQRLLHPHIITFFDAYEAGRNLIIVMEIWVNCIV